MAVPIAISVRTCLIGLIALCALPALGIIWQTGEGQREAALEKARRDAMNLAAGFAEAQRDTTASVQSLVEILAEMPEVRAGDAAVCTSLFAMLKAKRPEIANILAVSTTGEVIASAMPASRGNLGDRLYMR